MKQFLCHIFNYMKNIVKSKANYPNCKEFRQLLEIFLIMRLQKTVRIKYGAREGQCNCPGKFMFFRSIFFLLR